MNERLIVIFVAVRSPIEEEIMLISDCFLYQLARKPCIVQGRGGRKNFNLLTSTEKPAFEQQPFVPCFKSVFLSNVDGALVQKHPLK